LIPVEANLEEALKGARGSKMLDDSEGVENTLFEIDVAPPEASEPKSAKDDRGSFSG
jgi:hypothetical protein